MKCPGRRSAVLGILLLCGGSIVVAGYQAPGGGRQGRGGDGAQVIQVEKLKDNLFVLKGGGGNTAVFVGTDGVTVVDTKNPGLGPADPRQDQGADREADHDDHQHAHARRSRERQRRVSRRRSTSSRRRTRKTNMKKMRCRRRASPASSAARTSSRRTTARAWPSGPSRTR